MNGMRTKMGAALVALLVCAPVALATSAADKQAAPARALSSSTTSTDAGGAKSTVNEYDDGSGDMTVDLSSTAPAVQARMATCGPKVTDADIERWVNDQTMATDYPVGTGASTCTSGKVLAGSTGLKVPDALCASKSGSGNDVHLRLCVNYTVKERTSRKTTWSAKASSTAWTSDSDCTLNCDNLSSFKNYAANDYATVIEWAPTGTTTSIENCFSQNLGISSLGFSASVTVDKCPELYGSWAIGDHSSGARWYSDKYVGQGISRSADFVHLATSPRSSDPFRIRSFVTWE